MSDQAVAQLDPDGLEAYFTDVEHLRELFGTMVATPELRKRLLVIHGVGGVGKSSLLRMFRLHCKKNRVPVALASGDEARSAVDVLTHWNEDLKSDGIKLAAFAKTAQYYRAIQAKVEEQVRKAQEARQNAAGTLGKAAAKTIIETAASAIPVVGPLVSVLGGMSAEALVDWLSSFLRKPDIDLLLDPTKALTDDFLADVIKAATKQRLVLMLDTFEQISALEDWARDLAQRLHPNVLLVIAGRAVPDWSRQWPGWLALAEMQEVKPMTKEIMRELIRRYHATMRGGNPDPAQVEAIITFARGLPIVVTSAVRLWIQYGVEDFQAVKPQVVADLVDRLLEGVPPELVPTLEAAATIRWFNKDILRAVTGMDDVTTVYEELRRFPFTRPRVEGLALHDAVREIMDENLRVHDLIRHRELHQRAAVHFETQLEQMTGSEAERLELEHLYHNICADEKLGIQIFQKMAEEFSHYHLVNRLRILLSDVAAYSLRDKNHQLWRDYYNARLLQLERRLAEAEKIYQKIAETPQAEAKLRSYALCNWGGLLVRGARLSETGGIPRANQVLERARELMPTTDSRMLKILAHLQKISQFEGNWNQVNHFVDQRIQICTDTNNKYELVTALADQMRVYWSLGQWKNAFECQDRAWRELEGMGPVPYLKRKVMSVRHWLNAGRYHEAELNMRERLAIVELLGTPDDRASTLWNLGSTLGLQNKTKQAEECFERSLEILSSFETTGLSYLYGERGVVALRQGDLTQSEDYLKRSLEGREKVAPDDVPMLLLRLGEIAELRQQPIEAEKLYHQILREVHWSVRRYYQCGARTSLVRVKRVQSNYAPIPPLLAEAEQLAQQYKYNDHLASLRLSQGHIAWEGHIAEWGSGFEAALRYYQQALIYALRFNRFLLDEVLWGGGVCTPLRPIIPHCQERGEEGRQMLAALRDWWQTGLNDIGTPRPDTISPIPEGISLTEAEGKARNREPGDGKRQQTVLEKIETALAESEE